MPVIAVLLIVLAAGSRMFALQVPELGNFSPLMALTFCGGVYFRNRWMWLVPFVALMVSDLYIDHAYAVEYHYFWSVRGAVVRLLCFAAGVALGWLVSRRRSWATLAGGALASSLLFYVVTNTDSWLGDALYSRNAAGWWQALTVGHPEFPPTLYFFRNTLESDLLFTAVFALAMEFLARRRGEPSLLRAS
jgi:hypothetical protein